MSSARERTDDEFSKHSGNKLTITFPKLYTSLAKYYDRLEGQYRDYEVEGQWLRCLLQNAKSTRIIDISCGTGRHLEGITGAETSLQYEYVVAMDASKEMTQIALDRLSQRSKTETLRGDFLNIPFPDKSFDFAICMYWSLAGLEHEQAKTLFHEVSRILQDSGILVFDVENAEGIKENLLEEPFIDSFFPDPDASSSIIRANLSRKVEPDLVDWHAYYLIERDGVSELINDEMKLRFYSRSTLESFLSDSGFFVKSVSSSPGGNYIEKSPSLYFIAQKKAR
jgi:ubiquinone/menaquinone biosynthesis C-methylase UbiE